MKFLLFLVMFSGSIWARTGDTSFDYEVEQQLKAVTIRTPQSVDSEQKPENEPKSEDESK